MAAISAIDPAIHSVPAVATRKPYTTLAGPNTSQLEKTGKNTLLLPPFRNAPANKALVASHVQRVQADIAKTAMKFHSR
jgi:hypothetical protein